jgi:hypothetical protein
VLFGLFYLNGNLPSPLRDIAQEPERYQDDVTVFLALDTAVRRLTDGRGEVALDLLQHLLWDTAIRIEDGKLSIVRRNIQDAEEELRKALGNDASDEEID